MLSDRCLPATGLSGERTVSGLLTKPKSKWVSQAFGIIIANEGTKELELENGFKYNDLVARGDLFEEFYYEVSKYSLEKEIKNKGIYTVGDEVPLKGDSFEYPETLDILVIRDKVAVKIRNGKISDIIKLDEYNYDNIPVVNGRGFGLKINSEEDLRKFLYENEEAKEEGRKKIDDFLRKWVVIDKYRSLAFHSDFI